MPLRKSESGGKDLSLIFFERLTLFKSNAKDAKILVIAESRGLKKFFIFSPFPANFFYELRKHLVSWHHKLDMGLI